MVKDKMLSRGGQRMLPALLMAGLLALLPHQSSAAEECLDCHARAQGERAGIAELIKGNSHHVQGVEPRSGHCYACHWEANPDGTVNTLYHGGTPGAPVDLVIWQAGLRPQAYNTSSTVRRFFSSALGGAKEREQVAGISLHCMSCHSDSGNDTRPFAGDGNTPRRYAWDGQSISSRYSQKGITTWGKYSTARSNKKQQVVKAFSAHGQAALNRGGWSTAGGYDTQIPITRGGAAANNVECYDCHNSHGSRIDGITSSYPGPDGTYRGGLLKETFAGTSGYSVTYRPSSNPDKSSVNPYNSGAGLCFDCHENAAAGPVPWGYNATFGASQPIMGYKDSAHFGNGPKGSSTRFSGRRTASGIASSHLKAGKFLNYTAQGRIGGLCTPCHDPHGVSPTLGFDMQYAVPLLKGTWLTSPYREDAPPTTTPTRGSYNGKSAAMNMSWDKGNLQEKPAQESADTSFNIDRNTFGDSGGRISETDELFGGLCMKCHLKKDLTSGREAKMHRAVKGWGTNKEHAFPCSKCHQPHNSGLPRLMQTNCLESGPSGLRDAVAAPWIAGREEKEGGTPPQAGAAGSKKEVKESVVGCHVRRAGNRASGPAGGPRRAEPGQWNSVNPW